MNKILIVEDDLVLSEMLEEFLQENGYETLSSASFTDGLDLAYSHNFDLWILDVKIEKGDGFSLLKQLREANLNTPAIFTTSLNTICDLEIGYKAGCDDYLKKPYELKELLIRIRALIKRNFSHKNDEFEHINENLKLNLDTKTLYENDKVITLSQKEMSLLILFLQNKNRYLSVEEIYEKLWEYDQEPSYMSLRVYIKNLRKIIGKEKILTQRGNGYMYEER